MGIKGALKVQRESARRNWPESSEVSWDQVSKHCFLSFADRASVMLHIET